MNAASFWWWLTIACLVWYTSVTAYVSVRGAIDIKGMLARLSASQDEEVATESTEGTENGSRH
jgi:hypothetical protein